MLFPVIRECLVPRKLCNIKNLWSYVAIAFNKVDFERLKLVGPDRLCSEWILKNGGSVSFTLAPQKFVQDYNSLPPESTTLRIKAIDASDSSIMKIGLDHLNGCKSIDKVILHQCKHLESGGLAGLVHIKSTLNHLQVSACFNLTDDCLLVLKELQNLKYLKLANLQFVKDIEKVADELKKNLVGCEIEVTK